MVVIIWETQCVKMGKITNLVLSITSVGCCYHKFGAEESRLWDAISLIWEPSATITKSLA